MVQCSIRRWSGRQQTRRSLIWQFVEFVFCICLCVLCLSFVFGIGAEGKATNKRKPDLAVS